MPWGCERLEGRSSSRPLPSWHEAATPPTARMIFFHSWSLLVPLCPCLQFLAGGVLIAGQADVSKKGSADFGSMVLSDAETQSMRSIESGSVVVVVAVSVYKPAASGQGLSCLCARLLMTLEDPGCNLPTAMASDLTRLPSEHQEAGAGDACLPQRIVSSVFSLCVYVGRAHSDPFLPEHAERAQHNPQACPAEHCGATYGLPPSHTGDPWEPNSYRK